MLFTTSPDAELVKIGKSARLKCVLVCSGFGTNSEGRSRANL
jgi:hypothetical protein